MLQKCSDRKGETHGESAAMMCSKDQRPELMAAVLIDPAEETFGGCLIQSELLPKVWAMALKTLGHVRM